MLLVKLFDKVLRAGEGKTLRKLEKITVVVNSLEGDFEDLTTSPGERLSSRSASRAVRTPSTRCCRRPSRQFGRHLGEPCQRHYDVQIMGGAPHRQISPR
jgi:preprotein translocase subunit SecA